MKTHYQRIIRAEWTSCVEVKGRYLGQESRSGLWGVSHAAGRWGVCVTLNLAAGTMGSEQPFSQL